MTTQTPTPPPTDNERLSRLEGIVEQIVIRLDGFERRLDGVESRLDSLRTMMFMGFGFLWASTMAGFIAIFIAILNINP